MATVTVYKLTSPLMRGPYVKRMQEGMIKHGWLKGAADGVYGPLTAQAVYRSKYWLGYQKLDQTAADIFLGYIEGKRPVTDAMKKRAASRKLAQEKTPLRQKALIWLTQHIGDKENPPNSNRISWASEWYGVIGPWCAMAVTRAYVEAGSQTFKRTQYYSYVPNIVSDAIQGRNNLALTRFPEAGDLVCYDWDGDGWSDHVGLFERWTDSAHQAFTAVEGNTSEGNDSNGGEVMRRNRSRGSVRAFVHVGR